MSQKYTKDLNNEKRIIRTLDAVSINYDGRQTDKLFACTITSRKKYNNLYTFRYELYEFLKSIDYKYGIKGFMEFHNQRGRQDKVHAHCVVYFGNPPKNNKQNPFNFQITKLENPTIWDNYCKKDIINTLEQQHNIKTGLFNYYKKPVYLWGKDEDME